MVHDTSCALMARYGVIVDGLNTATNVVMISAGTNFSVEVCTVEQGVFETISVAGAPNLLERVNRILMDYFIEDFMRLTQREIRGDKFAICKLRLAAEQAKHTLSINMSAHVYIKALQEEIDCYHNHSSIYC